MAASDEKDAPLQAGLEVEDITVLRPHEDSERIREGSHHRRSLEDLQEQVFTLFQQFVPKPTAEDEDSSQDEGDSPRSRTVLCRDLPHLLSEFEKQRGSPLVEAEGRSQLETFCEQLPDTPIDCDDLVKMIDNLQNAQSADDVEQHVGHPGDDDDNAQSSASSVSSASDGDEDGLRDPHQLPRSSTPPRVSSANATPFPSSIDDTLGGDRTVAPEDDEGGLTAPSQSSDLQRSRTSSASAAQTRIPQRDGGSQRERHRSTTEAGSKSGGSAADREILKGKGRAPPSSWSRPRPQALAARSRQSSSAASSSFDGDEGLDDRASSVESPGPQQKRQRQTSQPIATMAEPEDSSFSASGSGVPRSVSSGYIFPRATSPGMGDESWYAEQEDKWERGSDRARSPSYRAVSPGLDSPRSPKGLGSFQAFGALSSREPTSPRFPRSTSHNDDLWANQYQADAEALEVLQRQYDNLARVLQDKERAFEGTQSQHETTIADLETKVDSLQDRIHTLTKSSEEMKHKEQRYLDEISRLEGDLAISQKRGEGLERTREVMAEDLNRREQSLTTLQGKIKELQERVAAAEMDEAEHFQHQRDWERDREQYRDELEGLRRQLSEAEEGQARVEELESEREALQAQLRQVHADMEEARRNSGFLAHGSRNLDSMPPSMSKRLGTELASIFGSNEHSQESERGGHGDEEDDEDGARTLDADDSAESIVVTTTRHTRRRREKTSDDPIGGTSTTTTVRSLADSGIQTDEVEEDVSRAHGHTGLPEASPPTYDEAAMEKSIIARLHPPSTSRSTAKSLEAQGGDDADGAGSTIASRRSAAAGLTTLLGLSNLLPDENEELQADYDSVTDGTDLRCTVLEDAIKDRRGRKSRGRRRLSRRNWSRVLSQLPPETNTGNLLFCGLTTMAMGVLLGSLYSSNGGGPHIYQHHYPGGGVVEDWSSWQLYNSLSQYPPPHTEVPDGVFGFLLGIFLKSARYTAGVGNTAGMYDRPI